MFYAHYKKAMNTTKQMQGYAQYNSRGEHSHASIEKSACMGLLYTCKCNKLSLHAHFSIGTVILKDMYEQKIPQTIYCNTTATYKDNSSRPKNELKVPIGDGSIK